MPRPVVNVTSHLEAGARHRLGPVLGASRLDAALVELDPGEGAEPYHHVYGREEWLMVLAGAPTLHHEEGEEHLVEGDLICLPEGPAGGRHLVNGGESVVRALLLGTTDLPVAVHYPQTGRWLLQTGPGSDDRVLLDPGAGPRGS